ncbi:ATP-grasp domain-containing protein [Amycolatopsis sp. SID8362]|uniref:ATP-grasp domain-containing protein n=1 Tax=Amycolatopsis sp. SID8362 TaxID=2690346 RepID=UPI00136E7870|nr:ATP-grasp domain-containing protein [Amycolatopsis sp. SID8362]NBH08576.1 ATP-grasp domain-containing protein [Amycolatopsis sp. SID8362]NED45270.1 ATP-grasp domain-containing protein [Amycolatopsis sp. SID8362]
MTKPTVVIVDPYSSGNLLAAGLRAAGFSIVGVLTSNPPPEVYRASFFPDVLDEYFFGETVTPDLVSRLHETTPVAVLAGAEPGVELADLLAAELTPHLANTPALGSARRHKGHMVEGVAAQGLRTIRTVATDDPEEVGKWLDRESLTGCDLVVKPAKSVGADGVTFVRGGTEWRRAFDDLIGATNRLGARNEQVVVQERVVGVEYVVNTFTFDGEHAVTDIACYRKVLRGESAAGSAAIYESVRFLPCAAPGNETLVAYTRDVLDALGIRFGPAHTELMLTEDGPVLIETGARIAGGGMPESARLATGDNAIGRLARYLRGDRRQRLDYHLRRSVIVVFLLPPSRGRIRNTRTYEAIRELPSCDLLHVNVRDGDLVGAESNLFASLDYGFAVLVHDDPAQTEADYARIRCIEKAIEVDGDSSDPVIGRRGDPG